jgi:hypothetical protein
MEDREMKIELDNDEGIKEKATKRMGLGREPSLGNGPLSEEGTSEGQTKLTIL